LEDEVRRAALEDTTNLKTEEIWAVSSPARRSLRGTV
jgi:hypothetical protein